MELSKRAVKAIRTAIKKRAFTPRAVACLHYNDLLRQPGCGTRTMNEIEEWLAWHGKTLRVMRRSLGATLLNMERRGEAPPPAVLKALRARLNSESNEGVYAATQVIRLLDARLNWQTAAAPCETKAAAGCHRRQSRSGKEHPKSVSDSDSRRRTRDECGPATG
jgi:hypothetical protein